MQLCCCWPLRPAGVLDPGTIFAGVFHAGLLSKEIGICQEQANNLKLT